MFEPSIRYYKLCLQEREVNINRPRYDPVSGQFLGLYESIGYLILRGEQNEQFLDYGFYKKNSKIFYSHHKRIIPSSFSDTFYKRQKIYLRVEVYRPRIQMSTTSYPRPLTVAKKLIDIWGL